MQQVICNVPFRDEFIVRWRFQLRNTLFREARKLLWRKILRRRGQRKVRLSESRPTLVTLFHLFPVGAKKNKHIFRAYPSTLKIAELRFETTAAHSIIIRSSRLCFLSLQGANFVGVLPLPLIFDLPEDS